MEALDRISVTMLEKFRRYMADAAPWDTEQSLIEMIKTDFTGNEFTVVGTALHNIIEDPHGKKCSYYIGSDTEYILTNNVGIPIEAATVCKNFHEQYPYMVHEVPIKEIYETTYGPILISARMDGVNGKRVHDFKSRYSQLIGIEQYTESCQNKFYLDMLSCEEAEYNVFELIGYDKHRGFNIKDLKNSIKLLDGISICQHDPIVCSAYDNMHKDLLMLIESFIKYVKHKSLEGYITKVHPVTHEKIKKVQAA